MNNEIIGNIKYDNAEIIFKGNNNKFICNNEITLKDCKIRFTGNNSLIYIDKNDNPISLNMRIGCDSVIYVGKYCYTNRVSNLYATERKNIILGNQILLSFDTYFRTADAHVLYDCNTKMRINESKSILVGDKVWIGQQSLILKGTTIGSGAIVGGHSVVSNKKIKSNSIYAGNPAKKLREGAFFYSPKSSHDFNRLDEENSMLCKENDCDKYIYTVDENTISLEKIDNDLLNIKDLNQKIIYIEKNIVNNNFKNRFYHD